MFIGALHRFAEICSSSETFLHQSMSTADILLERGCKPSRLNHCFKSFLTRRYSYARGGTEAHKARYLRFNPFQAMKRFQYHLKVRGAGEQPSLSTTTPSSLHAASLPNAATSTTSMQLRRSDNSRFGSKAVVSPDLGTVRSAGGAQVPKRGRVRLC